MKKSNRILALLLSLILCMSLLVVPAFAESSEWDDEDYEVTYDLNEEDEPVEIDEDYPEESAEEPQIQPPEPEPVEGSEPEEPEEPAEEPQEEAPEETEEVTGGMNEDELDELLGGLLSAFTPEGNLSLIDDFTFTGLDADGNTVQKQFITVQSKNGNYFYIIIDRVGESQNVYFLNMVDEADLLALMETGEEAPEVCTCKDKCGVGHIDTTCAVCAKDITKCIGEEPAPEPEPEPAPEPEEPEKPAGNNSMLLLLVLLIAGGAGGAVYFLKFRKEKPDTRGPAVLDDYDFGDDDEEYETEDEE